MGQPNDDQTQQLILLTSENDLSALLQMAADVVPTEDTPYVVVSLDEVGCVVSSVPKEDVPRFPAEYGLCAQHLTTSGYFVKNGTYVEYVPYIENPKSVVKEIQFFPLWLTRAVCRRMFTPTVSTQTEELDNGRISVRAEWAHEDDADRVTVIVDLRRHANTVKIMRRIPRVTNTIAIV